MPYCPECRYEYQAGVSECPDCSQFLVKALPTRGDQSSRPVGRRLKRSCGPRPLRLIEIFRGRSPEVRILEEALREEGIPSLVRPVEPLVALVGDLVPAMFSQLLVSVEEYEERRPLIEDCLQFVGR